jgi:pyrroloquinoline quinone (PQQ) biosynthesis protein C
MTTLLELRKNVEQELRATRIVAGVLEGRLRPEDYVGYLANARYYAQFSPVLMAQGAARCMASHPELARYLLHHAEEEQGHDSWALEDLADLGVPKEQALAMQPVRSCRALVGYVHYLAGTANPVGLFGWMYVLEAVGKDLGTIVGAALEGAMPKGRTGAVRFVARHGEADADHAEDLAEQIRDHVREEGDRAAVLDAAEVVADLYLRMFRELGGEQPRWSGTSAS